MERLKTKYDTQVLPNLDKISKWLEEGATVKAVAKKLKVGYSTLRAWLDRGERGDPDFGDLYQVVAESRRVADENVEHALYDRACGIRYDEETYERAPDPETGEPVMVLKKRVTKFVPPDTTSALFWLTNRMPGRYRYKPEPVQEALADQIGGVVELPAVMELPVAGPAECAQAGEN